MLFSKMCVAVVITGGMLSAGAAQAIAQNANTTDKQFIKIAIETNNAEIAAAHLALKKSNSTDIDRFAHRMIHDHSQLNQQMKPLARKIGVEVGATEVSPPQQQLGAQLQSLQGKAFDQKYIEAMVHGHQQALQKVQDEISGGQDPAVKKAAEKAKPIIEDHLKLANQMAKNHHISMQIQ